MVLALFFAQKFANRHIEIVEGRNLKNIASKKSRSGFPTVLMKNYYIFKASMKGHTLHVEVMQNRGWFRNLLGNTFKNGARASGIVCSWITSQQK